MSKSVQDPNFVTVVTLSPAAVSVPDDAHSTSTENSIMSFYPYLWSAPFGSCLKARGSEAEVFHGKCFTTED
jgi:hypothetical protein